MTPGIYEGMPFSKYQADPALNFSSLKLIDDCPETFFKERLNPDDPEERPTNTDEMKFGRAYHHFILEPSTFPNFFATVDKMTRRGADWEAIVAKAGSREIIFTEEYDRIIEMKKRLASHALFPGLIAKAKKEISVFWEKDGTPCKARIDIYQPELQAITDLKTCQSAHTKLFSNEIFRRLYYRQLAWYIDALTAHGLPVKASFIVAQAKDGYQIQIYQVPLELIELGRSENLLSFAQFQACSESNTWPGYPEEVVTVRMPDWKIREITGE